MRVFTILVLLVQAISAQVYYWEEVNDEINFANLLKADSSGNIYAASRYSAIYHSTNFGETWDSLDTGFPYNSSSFAVAPDSAIWLANSFEIYRKANSAANWETVTTSTGSIEQMEVSADNDVYIVVDKKLYHTRENSSITLLKEFSAEIEDIVPIGENIVIVGDALGIYYTEDNFQTFTTSNISDFRCSDISNEINGRIYAVSDWFGGAVVSVDSGKSWTRMTLTYDEQDKIEVDDNGRVYIGYHKIQSSDDGGITWDERGGSNAANVCAIITYDSLVFAAGYSGIYRYDPNVALPVAQNYFNCEGGSGWQYIIESYTMGTNYYLRKPVLTDSVVHNGKTYYSLKIPYHDKNIRYDADENKLYEFTDANIEEIYLDFNLAHDEQFNSADYGASNLVSGTIYSQEHEVFGEKKRFYGLKSEFDSFWFVEDIGFAGSIGDSLIAAELHQNGDITNYSYHKTAQFYDCYKDTLLEGDLFNDKFLVIHPHSRYFGSDYEYWFNYINHVNIEYYYSNGVNSTEVESMDCDEVTYQLNCTTAIELDPMVLDGYKLYFRYVAVDKGFVPDTSFYPESGWQEVNYVPPVGVDEREDQPYQFSLSQNYPNPFNPETTIKFALPEEGRVRLVIYNTLGEVVDIIVDEVLESGYHLLTFNGGSLSSGVYYYRILYGGQSITKKLILLK
ncbi:MAG: hypothetical protein SCALA702_35700 [Melioribacteraceae bacterium]|nr:MAG: hypothetical protein SCALA702_35700 [Melioribacteraceae bacterium]